MSERLAAGPIEKPKPISSF